jgi:hypothetical protein
MTKTQLKKIEAGAYYMTQYASGMTDQGFYETLAESLPADIDTDRLAEWLNMTKDAPDRLNMLAYDHIFNLSNDILDGLIALYEAYEKGMDALMELLKVYPWVLFPDEHVGTSYDFEEMADADLKDFGLSAYAIHWAKDIPERDGLFKLNVYGEFEEIDEGDILDAIEEAGLIKNYLDNLK